MARKKKKVGGGGKKSGGKKSGGKKITIVRKAKSRGRRPSTRVAKRGRYSKRR